MTAKSRRPATKSSTHPPVPPKRGQQLTAKDILERLLQDVDPAELLLWPPNLFAFTSQVLSYSGAYQLVVSPPPSVPTEPDSLYHWPPTQELIDTLVRRANSLAPKDAHDRLLSRGDVQFGTYMVRRLNVAFGSHCEQLWTFMVRHAALQWRSAFDSMSIEAWVQYCDAIPSGFARESNTRNSGSAVQNNTPPLLNTCWALFNALYLQSEMPPDIGTLLCNGAVVPTGASQLDTWLSAVALLTIHAIADDACVGWGILQRQATLPVEQFPSLAYVAAQRRSWRGRAAETKRSRAIECATVSNTSPAQAYAAECLDERGTMTTISASRARVLPKRHNPDVGITLRSISSNLAYHLSSIEIIWRRSDQSPLAKKLNPTPDELLNGASRSRVRATILLLPFPTQVHTKDFAPFGEDAAERILDNRSGYAFFEYAQSRPTRGDDIVAVVNRAITEEDVDVDIAILPELSIDAKDVDGILHHLGRLGEPVSLVVAGVNEGVDGERFARNNAVYYRYWTDEGYRGGSQNKHHRWQLNRSQIQQYGLSQTLDVDTKWWEAINVGRRRVSFVNIGDGITVCPLICEDLARQDPIADLIRQVGPSLVVAILMDGPQHKDRWASRYAAILAEDPGSAVLALTSFGMVRRWNTRFRGMSRVIALWNDKGGSREIELEQGAAGVLLSVLVDCEREVIADGRLEMCATSKITLEDVIQIHPGQAQVN